MIASRTHDDGFETLNSDSTLGLARSHGCEARPRCRFGSKAYLIIEDVLLACEYGCDGVIVSNHGGRQLDGTPGTIDALPECVKPADGKFRMRMDGAIRTGADGFKAIALGAECWWIGRPAI